MSVVTKPIVLDETVKEFNQNLTGILNNITKAETKATAAAASATLAQAWAKSDSSPDGTEGNKSAKTYASEAAASATSANQAKSNAESIASQLTTYINTKETLSAPAIDTTLLISGAAADSKVVGDKVSEIKEDLVNVENALTSEDLCVGTYVKAYWDWVSDYFYLVESNEFISENAYHEYVNAGDVFIVTKPNNVSGTLQVMFNNHTVVSTTSSYVYFTIPNGVTKFAIRLVSALPLNQFNGFTIKQVYSVKKELSKKQNTLTFDSKPIENSNNPVTSNGIYTETKQIKDNMNVLIETLNLGENLYDSSLAYKGYKDWLGTNEIYTQPHNEFICTDTTYSVQEGDIVVVKRHSEITRHLVLITNYERNFYSTLDDTLVVKIPNGVTKIGIYCISTLPLSDFTGFEIYVDRVSDRNDISISASYTLKDYTKHIVHVDANGNGDYTSISDAYNSIKDSYSTNQYEILVHPGTYNEVNLICPPYTHTHGVYPNTVIVTSDGKGGTLPVFDEQASVKLSNMTIISDTGYCIHYDSKLYNKSVYNENLYLIKRTYGNIIGGGCFQNGSLVEWRNCTFENGYVSCHTNNFFNLNAHIKFINCHTANALYNIGSVGGNGRCIWEMEGCNNAEIIGWTSNPQTVESKDYSFMANTFEWQLLGNNNKNIKITPYIKGVGEGLVYTTANNNENIEISGSAIPYLFGSVKYRKGFNRQKGRAFGTLMVKDEQAGTSTKADVYQMWKRLGNCSSENKTLSVTVGSNTQTFTFNKNYLTSKDSEVSILSAINNTITIATLEKNVIEDVWDNIWLEEKTNIHVHSSATGSLKGEWVSGSGFLSNNPIGMALEDSAPNESQQIWVGKYLYVSGYEDGTYGAVNGVLTKNAPNPFCTISNNLLTRTDI